MINRRRFIQGISTAVLLINGKSLLATDLSAFEKRKPILRFAIAA
jgi:hypothetical protein